MLIELMVQVLEIESFFLFFVGLMKWYYYILKVMYFLLKHNINLGGEGVQCLI